jgi:hypothetical protein
MPNQIAFMPLNSHGLRSPFSISCLSHRTGILQRFNANHQYGLACYQPGGCADILQTVAGHIDARQFNSSYPQVFPRFVQHAIWRYCSQSGLDVCNGNRIDDRRRCENPSSPDV